MLYQGFESRWMSIERKAIDAVRVINEWRVMFFPKKIYKFMER